MCSVSGHAYNFSTVASTYDLSGKQQAIGHFNLNDPKAQMIVDVPHYSNWANEIDSSMLAPWEYISFVGIGAADSQSTDDGGSSVIEATIFFLRNGTRSKARELSINVNEIHCIETGQCYAIDLNSLSVVQFNPTVGSGRINVEHLFNISTHFDISGLTLGSSSFDSNNLILYASLSDVHGHDHLLELHIATKTTIAIAGAFEGDTGPFCFDPTLGLVSLGNALGTIVAYNSSSRTTHVLFSSNIGGLPGNNAFDCSQGILVVALVDFVAPRSPTILVAFDLLAKDGNYVFHNHTIVNVQGMYFADRNAVRLDAPRVD